ncbi:AMP-dependent synthetase [Westiellopsis prolifica IICB1]|nr:AMP-dependent synthetase [Westiellopsis prolifica IICB1]
MTSVLTLSPTLPSHIISLVDLLCYRAQYQPEQIAYIFLQDEEIEAARLTYQELDRKARSIAAHLQFLGVAHERALLLYPPGLEFITAFFGCLYADVIAIPGYPPRPNRSMSRLEAIVADADASIVLTTASLLESIERRFAEVPGLAALRWVPTCKIANHLSSAWQKATVSSDSLAFLQYTSGSTGNPKGVMVSHGNLLSTSADLDLGWVHTSESIMVTWLPTFHDMGLIYGVLQPLYKGFPAYMMAPLSFLQRPYLWLKAISRLRATHSAAPNFAYDLCIRRISPEQRATLDLSSWYMALNGAEPVRADVLEQFAETFKTCGFNRTAFCPGYGLAEASLKVSAVRKGDSPTFYGVEAEALEQNQVVEASKSYQNVKTLVGCGYSEIDAKIAIINPKTLTCSAPKEVGEIWVSSASVAQGYWNRSKETEQTFHAYLKDTGEGPFLRTGDLGFLKDGELFVTGRIKDIIIIRGRNYYPQDIELTIERSHPALRPSCSIAFTIEAQGQERLVVVQEVERSYLRKLDMEEVVGNIYQALQVEHELEVFAIVLLKTGNIPKTSSGKVQRQTCKAMFLEGKLDVVHLASRGELQTSGVQLIYNPHSAS